MEAISTQLKTHLDLSEQPVMAVHPYDMKCWDSSSQNSPRSVWLHKAPHYLKEYATIATKGLHPYFPYEPKNLRGALKDPSWIVAMEE